MRTAILRAKPKRSARVIHRPARAKDSWGVDMRRSCGCLAVLASLLVTGCFLDGDGNNSNGVVGAGNAPPPATLTTGLQSMMSQGIERCFYIRVPTDYAPLGPKKPILIAFHGTWGSHARWLAGGPYGDPIIPAVGDDAIIVMPDATPCGQAQVPQFDRDTDPRFFLDLLDFIQQDLSYDEKRVFITGQSSGAGFTNELACQFGDIIRGAAPNAGSLLSNRCVGAVAIMLIAGQNDELVPITIVEPTHQFWVTYNGFDLNTFQNTAYGPCVDHSLGASSYPMLWCLHPGEGNWNHNYPAWAGQAMWNFFTNLPAVEPGPDEPPGGGNDRVADEVPTQMSVTLDFPATTGNVVQIVAALQDQNWQPGDFTAPIWFMNLDIPFDPIVAGTQVPLVFPVNLPPAGNPPFDYPQTFVVNITVYMEGGNFPIPTGGIDHTAWTQYEIMDDVTPIVINNPLPVQPYPP